MDVKQELRDLIQKVWTKLQALPQATPLEIGTFAVVILFMGQYKLLFHLIHLSEFIQFITQEFKVFSNYVLSCCCLPFVWDVSSGIFFYIRKEQILRFKSEDQISLQKCVAWTFFCICNPTRAEREVALRTFTRFNGIMCFIWIYFRGIKKKHHTIFFIFNQQAQFSLWSFWPVFTAAAVESQNSRAPECSLYTPPDREAENTPANTVVLTLPQDSLTLWS